ncbi:hypothetical protein L211DRAFT_850527 [Terfezia boudieri ATCC MYA-4762]|uniref:Uncharacterized protein n=1 Tax=Terfezia boudieri ATCC MYA-4762 TaxID=1051890 RepID=A0A3N4LP85_9PEZI|nr:hypothetical protein L211DRAFT_850527 [Terfezia boudieri ATCC MYA-4762]
MEAKGTFGLQVEVIAESEDNNEKYAVTAMHVTTPVPLRAVCPTNVRVPGLWDLLSHINIALNLCLSDPSTSNESRLRQTLRHLTQAQIVGECIAGWIGIDEFGFREDWGLIQISNQCQIQGLSSIQRWGEDILSQVQNWGIQIDTLDVVGYRDPQPGEIAFVMGLQLASYVEL